MALYISIKANRFLYISVFFIPPAGTSFSLDTFPDSPKAPYRPWQPAFLSGTLLRCSPEFPGLPMGHSRSGKPGLICEWFSSYWDPAKRCPRRSLPARFPSPDTCRRALRDSRKEEQPYAPWKFVPLPRLRRK